MKFSKRFRKKYNIAADFAIENNGIEDVDMTKPYGKIRKRDELTKKEAAALETEWLGAPTALSFSDWLYIHHNVFAYHPTRDTIIKNINVYKSLAISNPSHKHYVSFVHWLVANNTSFHDEYSGRSSEDIIKLYDAEQYNRVEVEKTQPTVDTKIVVGKKDDLTPDEWEAVVTEYEESSKEFGLYDWLLIYHRIADIQTGASFVDEYNESTFSDLADENFLVFSHWLTRIKKVERQASGPKRITFTELGSYCIREWNLYKEDESEDVIPFPKKKGTMTVDEVNQKIKQIESDLVLLGNSSLEQKLALAIRYRNRLLDKMKKDVYNSDEEQLCLPLL